MGCPPEARHKIPHRLEVVRLAHSGMKGTPRRDAIRRPMICLAESDSSSCATGKTSWSSTAMWDRYISESDVRRVLAGQLLAQRGGLVEASARRSPRLRDAKLPRSCARLQGGQGARVFLQSAAAPFPEASERDRLLHPRCVSVRRGEST